MLALCCNSISRPITAFGSFTHSLAIPLTRSLLNLLPHSRTLSTHSRTHARTHHLTASLTHSHIPQPTPPPSHSLSQVLGSFTKHFGERATKAPRQGSAKARADLANTKGTEDNPFTGEGGSTITPATPRCCRGGGGKAVAEDNRSMISRRPSSLLL